MPDELRSYQERERITEAGVAGLVALGDGDYRVQLISHGKTRDHARYYRQEALEAAASAGLYDGAKMYLNHRDPTADARRGHRDVRDWAATVREGSTRFVNGALEAVAHVHDERLRAVLDDEVAKGEMGLSQDATVTFHNRAIDGEQTHVVEAIERVHSVDFVPTGNAWGRVLEAYADGAEDTEDNAMPTLADVTLDVLEVERPDLVEAMTERVREAEASTRTYESWNGLSADAVRDLVSAAIHKSVGKRDDEIGVWVRELYEDAAIVAADGVAMRYTYAIVDNEAVLGEKPVEVRQEWVPVRATEAVVETEGDVNTEENEEAASMSADEQTLEQPSEEANAEDQAAETEAQATEDEATEQDAAEEQEAAPETDWQARAEAAEAELARRDMREAVREAVTAVTGLTSTSKTRVVEALSAGAILAGDALTEAVETAVQAERAHEVELAKALGIGTRVKRSGPSIPTPQTETAAKQSEEAREAAREQFRVECRAMGITDESLIERLAAAR